MKPTEKFCKCLKPLSFGRAVKQLWDEIVEFYQEPSLDELSDCAFALGRLLAAIFGRVYIHIPFDQRHWAKIGKRMEVQGCVRSQRHLKFGKCPSELYN